MNDKFIDIKQAVDEGFLQDWYISSVNPNDTPQWTEAHIHELVEDFYIIPKDAPFVIEDKIENCNFSMRTYNALKRNGINYLSQLDKLDESDLREMHDIGNKAVNEIILKVNNYKLTLSNNIQRRYDNES